MRIYWSCLSELGQNLKKKIFISLKTLSWQSQYQRLKETQQFLSFILMVHSDGLHSMMSSPTMTYRHWFSIHCYFSPHFHCLSPLKVSSCPYFTLLYPLWISTNVFPNDFTLIHSLTWSDKLASYVTIVILRICL